MSCILPFYESLKSLVFGQKIKDNNTLNNTTSDNTHVEATALPIKTQTNSNYKTLCTENAVVNQFDNFSDPGDKNVEDIRDLSIYSSI